MGASLSIGISQGTQDIANNRTYVTATVYITATGSTWNGYGAPTSIWGSLSGSQTTPFYQNTTTAMLSVGGWVGHNSDGTCTVSFGASCATGVSPGTIYASASLTLTTIPRASDVSGTDVTSGGSTTITVSPKANFTDTAVVTFGSHSATVINAVSGSGTKTGTLQIPDSWLDAIPDALSGLATVTVTTRSGSTVIGTKTSTFKVTARNYGSSLTCSQSISEGASLPTQFRNKWIQTLSQPKLTITSAGYQGSTIASIKTRIETTDYEGATFTANALVSSGTVAIKTTITDTRGISKEVTTNITVVPYHAPQISASVVASGNQAKIHITGEISPVNNANTKSCTIAWSCTDGRSGTIPHTLSGYTFDSEITHSNIDATLTYTYTISIRDAKYTSIVIVKTGIILMSRHAGGDGITLGTEAETDGLVLAPGWDIKYSDPTFVAEMVAFFGNDILVD